VKCVVSSPRTSPCSSRERRGGCGLGRGCYTCSTSMGAVRQWLREYGYREWVGTSLDEGQAAMARKEEAQAASKRVSWVIWGLLAALVLLFASAFSKAWQTNLALKAELEALRPVATAAMAQKEALETRVAYVQSDEYVESWSQTHAGMTRSGETLIIPTAPTPTPTPQPALPSLSTPEPTEIPFLPKLWRSLFGN
jgi:cell division protein FtsB